MKPRVLPLLPLIIALAFAACGGDDYEQSLIDALAENTGQLSEDTGQCGARATVQEIGAETLREDGYTAENIGARFEAGGPLQYLSFDEASALLLNCAESAEDLALILAPSSSTSVVADYTCAIEDLGVDDARDLALDLSLTDQLDDDPEFRAALNSCRGVDREADDEESAPAVTTTTRPPTTTTTAPMPERPSFAADTPPLVAVKSLPRAPGPGEVGRAGPAGPFGFLDNAASERAVVTETDAMIGSPDGTMVAIREQATAIDDAAIRILSVASGQEIDVLDVDQPNLSGMAIRWSDDSRALAFDIGRAQSLFYRVGTGVTIEMEAWTNDLQFAGTAEASTAVACGRSNSAATIADDGTTSQIELPPCYNPTQVANEGDTLVAYTDRDNVLWRLAAGGEPEQLAPTAGRVSGGAGCDGVWIFFSVGQDRQQWVIDLPSGSVAEELVDWGSGCPIRSPDGTKLAHWIPTGGVEVLDLTTGLATQVANTGIPWAFSSDGEQLLVSGGGTFVVATDGSGGSEATAQSTTGNRVFCRAGDSGTGLLATQEGIGLFDVGRNLFTPIDVDLRMPRSCFTSADDRWLLADGVLVELSNGSALDLHQVDIPSGTRLHDRARPEPSSERRLAEFMWAGPQVHVAAARPGR